MISVCVLNPPPYLASVRYRLVKRGLDFLVSITALVVLAPLFPLVALVVKLTSEGPLFYRWNVVGEGGRQFVGYKLRTMVQNADALRPALSLYNERGGPAFKMKNDPRVTYVGRFLRRFSLDELPQFLNIAKGEMSLIGPRPLQVHEWRLCSEHQKQRNHVKPGAVSLWHVAGQPPSFNEWIDLDLQYIAEWSLRLDLIIFLKAIGYIVGAKNQ